MSRNLNNVKNKPFRYLEKSVLSRGTSKYKGPGVGACMHFQRLSGGPVGLWIV